MAGVPAAAVKALRDRTGAGMMDAKSALTEAEGDADKAMEILRVKGQAQAAKRGSRAASEGLVSSYVHHNGRVGVLLEVDCETDFVARNEDFQAFVREVAAHIAASAPRYVSDDDVPDDVRDAERRVLAEQAAHGEGDAGAGKPEHVQERIAEGRMRKWLDEVVLLRQTHVNEDKHERKTIEELRAGVAASTGENVVIRRFARFAVGD